MPGILPQPRLQKSKADECSMDEEPTPETVPLGWDVEDDLAKLTDAAAVLTRHAKYYIEQSDLDAATLAHDISQDMVKMSGRIKERFGIPEAEGDDDEEMED